MYLNCNMNLQTFRSAAGEQLELDTNDQMLTHGYEANLTLLVCR